MAAKHGRGRRRRGRVFLGVVEVAGYYTALRDGFEELGVQSEFVDLYRHPFQYGADRTSRLVQWTRAAGQRRIQVPVGHRARRSAWLVLEGVLRLTILAWAAARFDVFVFGFGGTFLGRPRAELAFLRLLGKRIICVFHGSDTRPPYMDGAQMATDRGRTLPDCLELARRTKALVAAIERHAHYIVTNPLSAHFHERRCVKWLMIGVPCRPGAMPEVAPASDDLPLSPTDRPIRILHSPSHPEAKGTERIRGAIAALRHRGHRIEFVEITGRPNTEVLSAIAACDFVVDQLYSDTPMAGFATEAAHLGKPAVVGGYGTAAFRQFIPPEAMPPVLYCHPDAIETAIERLVTDHAHRRDLGRQAQQFVRSRWTPREVAARFLQLVDGSAPDEWLFDPHEIDYLLGCALPEERTRALVAGVLDLGGSAALQLADKPELERLMVELAGRGSDSRAVAC